MNNKLETITVKFKASDFKNNEYVDSTDCPLARAVRRTLKISKSKLVGVDCFEVDVYVKREANISVRRFKNGIFDIYKYREVKALFEANPKTDFSIKLTELELK